MAFAAPIWATPDLEVFRLGENVERKNVYTREQDRFEDSCEACSKLQKFAPGKKCFDCIEAKAWAAKQVKTSRFSIEAEADEIDLAEDGKEERFCTNQFCQHEGGPAKLPKGYRYFCVECHARLSARTSNIDTQFQFVLTKNVLSKTAGKGGE